MLVSTKSSFWLAFAKAPHPFNPVLTLLTELKSLKWPDQAGGLGGRRHILSIKEHFLHGWYHVFINIRAHATVGGGSNQSRGWAPIPSHLNHCFYLRLRSNNASCLALYSPGVSRCSSTGTCVNVVEKQREWLSARLVRYGSAQLHTNRWLRCTTQRCESIQLQQLDHCHCADDVVVVFILRAAVDYHDTTPHRQRANLPDLPGQRKTDSVYLNQQKNNDFKGLCYCRDRYNSVLEGLQDPSQCVSGLDYSIE